MKIINYEIDKTTFGVYACQSVGFCVCRTLVYLAGNILTQHCVGSFILQRHSVYHVVCLPSVWILHGASAIRLDLPSVFLSGKDLYDPVDSMIVCLSSEVEPKMIFMGHPISSCHVPVVRSFFILFETLVSL